MGIREWWQRLWRRLRNPADATMSLTEARSARKEDIARWDTRHRGGSML